MTSTDAPEVVVDDLRASYDRCVLTAASFTAPPGTTTVVSGSPGSGKTTLVRILLGRLAPERGAVTVGGRSVVGAGGSELADIHRRTAFLFSGLNAGAAGRKGLRGGSVDDPDDGVAVKATVGENVRTALVDPDAEGHAVRRWLETFDLVDDEHRPARELGTGARRRLGLARVFAAEPALVLLDDPVAALDPEDRDAVIAALQRARPASDATVVVTCFDVTTARAVGDHLVVLVNGRVRAQGPAGHLLRLVKSDSDFAVHFSMGRVTTDSSTESLDEYRRLGRFRGYDQSVIIGITAVVGFALLMVLLVSIWWRFG